jgi:hypothetical protein
MVDPQNDHGGIVVVDVTDNTVGAPTYRPQTPELPLQRVADPARRAYQSPGHELDDCSGDAFGQASQ